MPGVFVLLLHRLRPKSERGKHLFRRVQQAKIREGYRDAQGVPTAGVR